MEDLKIVAVRKDTSGEIDAFKLSDGRVVEKVVAFQMVNRGELKGYVSGVSSLGEAYIRSAADGDPTNNLGNLPSFE